MIVASGDDEKVSGGIASARAAIQLRGKAPAGCNRGDLGRQREDDMEVSDRQEISLALGEPCACGGALALRAVPVPAGIVGNAPFSAILAGPDTETYNSGERRKHSPETAAPAK